MSRSLNALRTQAELQSGARGHCLTWGIPIHGKSASLQAAACRYCDLDAQVITRPWPNEANVTGEALAINCHHVGHHDNPTTK